ncbi:hypothetical protein JTE90_023775 [Oedothorax gibbosus]|uniref:Cuticle protein n=1 Tax=Oedothorax gibbosus TaxID=931172 RepID=A0AAV6UUF6_9ARAC|nr:hypothetical protein JTE90_023775 [Oedothorax gibbosus]
MLLGRKKLVKLFSLALLLCYLSLSTHSSPMPGEPVPEVVPDDYDGPPSAYIFGYRSDDGDGTTQHRHEESDGAGVIRGSYGFFDADGVYRTVNYTADSNGYRAVVRSNEPTFEAQSEGNAVFIADPQMLAIKGKEIAGRRKPLNDV